MNEINSVDLNGVPTYVFNSLQAAKALGISTRTLWSLTKEGRIPHVRLGKGVRYPCHVLREWLSKQVVGGGNALPLNQGAGVEDVEKIKCLKSNCNKERMGSWQAS